MCPDAEVSTVFYSLQIYLSFAGSAINKTFHIFNKTKTISALPIKTDALEKHDILRKLLSAIIKMTCM